MAHRGLSHIGLSTLDLDKTSRFYQEILGFKPVVADTIRISLQARKCRDRTFGSRGGSRPGADCSDS